MQSIHPHRLILTLLFLALSTWACGLLPNRTTDEPDDTAEETARSEEPLTEETAVTYQGLGLEALEEYAAAFEVSFTTGEDPAASWSYTVDILSTGSPPALRRELSIEGAAPEQDPGDITLIQVGDTQYMIGEGTGEAGCLIFPGSYDLEESFLTPDNFLPSTTLADVALDPDGPETVAGQTGMGYTFEAESLGDFADASGVLVLEDEIGYVLRYDFTGSTTDSRFMPGREGKLSWHFEITSTDPGESLSVPDDCAIDLPVMADAIDLTSLFGITTYSTPSSSESVVTFYEEALPAAGWERYSLPATQDNVTLLVYAQGGEFLNVKIEATENGSDVQLLLERGS